MIECPICHWRTVSEFAGVGCPMCIGGPMKVLAMRMGIVRRPKSETSASEGSGS